MTLLLTFHSTLTFYYNYLKIIVYTGVCHTAPPPWNAVSGMSAKTRTCWRCWKFKKNSTKRSGVAVWRRWYIGPVGVANIVDNVSSYRLHASETQQLSYVTDTTLICYLCGVARALPSTNHQPTCNTPQQHNTVKREMILISMCLQLSCAMHVDPDEELPLSCSL